MEADRVRHDIKLGPSGLDSGEATPRGGQYSPRPSPIAQSFAPPSNGSNGISPLTTNDAVFADGLAPPDDIDIDVRSDWGTDAGGSASEVENDMLLDEPENGDVLEDLRQVWTSKPQPLREKTAE
jgi:hypothetical protein